MSQKDKITTIHGTVMKTFDYEKFKILKGNRKVLERRKQKIRKSVIENGQLFFPIIVNERMEIIDGQCRYEVFREMGLPIYYIIQPGLELNECQVFNSTATSWALQDYVDSYAAQGQENYIRLNSLIKSHPNCPIDTITFAAAGIRDARGSKEWDIKGGKAPISEQAAEKADKLLTYAERFLPAFSSGNGSKNYLLKAAMFCYGVAGIDRERLVNKWNKYGNIKSVKAPAVSIRDALLVLEKAYNFKSPTDSLMYFMAEYDKYCRSQNAAYATRWAEKLKKGVTQHERDYCNRDKDRSI